MWSSIESGRSGLCAVLFWIWMCYVHGSVDVNGKCQHTKGTTGVMDLQCTLWDTCQAQQWCAYRWFALRLRI